MCPARAVPRHRRDSGCRALAGARSHTGSVGARGVLCGHLVGEAHRCLRIPAKLQHRADRGWQHHGRIPCQSAWMRFRIGQRLSLAAAAWRHLAGRCLRTATHQASRWPRRAFRNRRGRAPDPAERFRRAARIWVRTVIQLAFVPAARMLGLLWAVRALCRSLGPCGATSCTGADYDGPDCVSG